MTAPHAALGTPGRENKQPVPPSDGDFSLLSLLPGKQIKGTTRVRESTPPKGEKSDNFQSTRRKEFNSVMFRLFSLHVGCGGPRHTWDQDAGPASAWDEVNGPLGGAGRGFCLQGAVFLARSSLYS